MDHVSIPSEVELALAMKLILADVEKVKPTRVMFDSLSELRLIAGNAFRYRPQLLALEHQCAPSKARYSSLTT